MFGLSFKVTLWFAIACVIGFPFWIAFAWFFRFTPHGIARENDAVTDAAALIYLGRYLYRGVIAKGNILPIDDGQVTFRYVESKTRKLPGADSLWLVLRHVVPRRFRRARHFGFLHPNCKRLVQMLHLLLHVNLAAANSSATSPSAVNTPVSTVSPSRAMAMVRAWLRTANTADKLIACMLHNCGDFPKGQKLSTNHPRGIHTFRGNFRMLPPHLL